MRRPAELPKVTADRLERVLKIWWGSAEAAQAVGDYVRDINARYVSWDEVCHRPTPAGLKPEEAWAAVRFQRGPLRHSPIVDASGRPFKYRLTDRHLEPLHQVDRLAGTEIVADVSGLMADDVRDRVLIDSLMQEAISTSQIEGAVTTVRRAKDMLRSGQKPLNRSDQMVVNGYRTMALIRERLDMPLSVDLIHELQRTITQDTLDHPERDAGAFRRTDDVFVVAVRDGEVIFTPPPASDLEVQMERLVSFANAEHRGEEFIHPLVKGSLVHFWLAYLHPYADGNGRTARALFYWYMLRQGYFLFQFLTVSRVIHRSRMQYYRAFLNSETDDNDLTYFLVYKVRAVQKAIADLHERLGEIRQEQQRMLALRAAGGLNVRQRAVLDHAVRHPTQQYTFESHQGSHGISYQTARTDLLGLAERGFLTDLGGRPRTFMPAVDLRHRLGL